MKKRMTRFLSLILAVAMIAAVMPMMAAAAAPESKPAEYSVSGVRIENDLIRYQNNGTGYGMSDASGKRLLYGGIGGSTSNTVISIGGSTFYFSPQGCWTTTDKTSMYSYMTYSNVLIEQYCTLVLNSNTGKKDTVEMKYIFTNMSSSSQNVGARIMFDTMLNDNDSAPFRVVMEGSSELITLTSEKEYSGNNIPKSWFAYDSLTKANPFVGCGTFYSNSDDKPDKVQFIRWGSASNTSFNNSVNGNSFGDSAVNVYFNPISLAVGESRTVSTQYGLSPFIPPDPDPDPSIAIYTQAPTALLANQSQTNYQSNPFQFIPTIKNTGNINLTNVKAELILPAGLSAEDQTLVYNIGTLAKNAQADHIWTLTAAKYGVSKTLTYQLKITATELSEPIIKDYTLQLPALHLTHTPGNFIVDTPATCTQSGSGHTVCSECGETISTGYIPATGHSYTVTDSKAATCTESGYITYTCAVCEATYTVTVYADHHYELAETQAASCTEEGYKLFRCSECGAEYTETIPAGQHNFVPELIRSATTEETGLLRYTCSICHETYDVEVPMLKEGVQLLLVQDRNSWDTVTNLTVLNKLVDDGYLAGWNIAKSSDLAALDLSGYGIILLANDQYASTYGNLESVNAKLTTYVELGGVLIYGACDNGWTNGNIAYTLPGGATKGNYYSSRNYIINAVHPVVTAALTNGDGLTNEILYHNYCSHSYFTNLPAEAQIILQDSMGKPTLAEYPIGAGHVILNGLTWEHAYYYLTYFSSYSYATKVYDDLIIYAATYAGAHTHSYDDGTVVAPNCTEPGYTLHTCAECGQTYRDNFVAALGHTPGAWIEDSQATCAENGVKHQICAICGETIQTEIIPAIGHDYVYTSTVEATCTEAGYILYTCSHVGCGETKRDVIPALGHDYGADNICDRCGHTLPYVHTHRYTDTVVAPTCTEMGYTLYACPCGASYKDNYMEPRGHRWDEGTVTTAKTCTSDGLMTYTCTECPVTFTEIIPAGHNWVEAVVTAATCTTDGEIRRSCADCGATETEVIPAGHIWDEGTVTVQPDCTTPGTKTCHCTRCEAEQTFEVPALGHNFYCGICQRCGIKFIDIINDDLSHPEYGMYFEIDDIVSNYGPDLINEYGVLLDYNSDAELDKVAVYLTQDGTMWRRCIACTGEGITYALYVPYLSYDEDIKYTGLNSDWINTFRLQKNADGIWNYSNYATIGVNLEDQYGHLLLSLYSIGKAGAKTRIFDDLEEMKAWLIGETEPHTHAFGEWQPVPAADGTVSQLKKVCSCGEAEYKNIETKFYTNTVSGTFGDTLDVDICVKADSYCNDMQLTFDYNSEIFEIVSVTMNADLPGLIKRTEIDAAKSQFKLIYSGSDLDLLTEDIRIATVTLKIKEDVKYRKEKAFRLAEGTYQKCGTMFGLDSYSTKIGFANGFGEVSILGPDPNNDGKLDIFDLYVLLSAMLAPTYDPYDPGLIAAMDCNEDNVFDISDISYLQAIIVRMN